MQQISLVDVLQERKEIVQDVVDRLLSNPEYKAALMNLNAKYPSLKDYNRRLAKDIVFVQKLA